MLHSIFYGEMLSICPDDFAQVNLEEINMLRAALFLELSCLPMDACKVQRQNNVIER